MTTREITDEEAWAFALENEGLANKLCRRFNLNGLPPGVDFEWLKSEAWDGLFNAAKKWDPEKARFSTFAMFVMKNHLLNRLHAHVAAQGGSRSRNSKQRVAWVDSIEGHADWLSRTYADVGDDFPEPAYLGVEDPGYEAVDEASEGQMWMERLASLDLNEKQRRIAELRVSGMMFKDIAEVFETSTQAVEQLWRHHVLLPLREMASLEQAS